MILTQLGMDLRSQMWAKLGVKTLEEIRMEKAARIQVKQTVQAEKRKRADTEENSVKKPRLLRIKKLAPQSKAAFLHIISVVHANVLHCLF